MLYHTAVSWRNRCSGFKTKDVGLCCLIISSHSAWMVAPDSQVVPFSPPCFCPTVPPCLEDDFSNHSCLREPMIYPSLLVLQGQLKCHQNTVVK